MSKYQALIDALDAPGLTDCQWEACGPSFGAPRPVYLNEVVAASVDEDDDGPLETVCRAPLGSKDECTADIAYIAAANPATIRAILADLERAEKALAALAKQAQEPVAWMWRKKASGTRGVYFEEPASFGLLGSPEYEWTMLYTAPPAPQPAPVDDRAEFEASMREKHGWEGRDFQSDSFGYFDGHTATAWLAWQDRAALSKPAPLAGEVTDEQIDAVSLAQWGPHHGAPLAAHRAFARAILALRPQAVPMTLEQINSLKWEPHESNPMTFAEGLRDFARQVEAHHGITAKAEGVKP